MHLCGPDIRRANRQAATAGFDQVEIHQFRQRLFQRIGAVITGVLGAQRPRGAGEGRRVRGEKSGHAMRHGQPVRELARRTQARSPPALERTRIARFARRPANVSTRASGRFPAMSAALIAPIEVPMTHSGSHPGLIQSLIDAGLISAKSAAALQDQEDPGRRAFGNRVFGNGGHLSRLDRRRRGSVVCLVHGDNSLSGCGHDRNDEWFGRRRLARPHAASSATPIPITHAGHPRRS